MTKAERICALEATVDRREARIAKLEAVLRALAVDLDDHTVGITEIREDHLAAIRGALLGG